MSGLNDDIGGDDFNVDDYLKKPEDTQQPPNNPITLVDNGSVSSEDSETVINELSTLDVNIQTVEDEETRLASMSDIINTISAEPKICKETIELIHKKQEGQYDDFYTVVIEEVSPIQGFTQEPSLVNKDKTVEVLQATLQEKQEANQTKVSEIVSGTVGRVKELITTVKDILDTELIGKAAATEANALAFLNRNKSIAQMFSITFKVDKNFTDGGESDYCFLTNNLFTNAYSSIHPEAIKLANQSGYAKYLDYLLTLSKCAFKRRELRNFADDASSIIGSLATGKVTSQLEMLKLLADGCMIRLADYENEKESAKASEYRVLIQDLMEIYSDTFSFRRYLEYANLLITEANNLVDTAQAKSA